MGIKLEVAAPAPLERAQASVKGKQFTDQQRHFFYSELYVLLEAGIDLRNALTLLAEEQKKAQLKARVLSLLENVEGGIGLSEAMQHAGLFSAYEFQSVKIGEESGKLTSVIGELRTYFQRRTALRRQFSGALAYPAFVMAVAAIAVGFMLYFIVPMFEDVFSQMGGELPALTQSVLNASDWIIANGLYLGLGLLIICLVILLQKETLWFRKYSAKVVLKIPVLGSVIREVQLARFCQAMALLTGARVSLLRALDLVGSMIQFYPLWASIPEIKQGIMNGQTLHNTLSKHSLYDKRLVHLVKVGEEAGRLEPMFRQLSGRYTESVEHKSKVLSSLLIPVVIALVGALVAVILVAMYLPLFEMSSNFGDL